MTSAARVETYADELWGAVGVVDSWGALPAVVGSAGTGSAGAASAGAASVAVVVSPTVVVVVVVVAVVAAACVDGPGPSAAKCAVDRCPLGYAGSGACTDADAACTSTYDGGASEGSPENSSGLCASSSGGGPGGGRFAYDVEVVCIGTALMYGWSGA